MKSCLKGSSLPGSPDPGHCRKCVAFNEGSEEVHWADEWDRTPTEPAKRLSYQELLELKEIQQSLPHAPQPGDALRPGKQLLSMVPIGLLPLAATETSTSPVSPPPQSSQSQFAPPQPTFVMPPGRARPVAPPRMASASLTHLRPPAPPAPRPKPAFAFLPLLSSPSPAPSPPSTPSASNADPGSYFPSYAYPPARSAADGEPDRVLPASLRPRPIPAAQQHPRGYEHAYRAAEAAAYSPPFGSSAYDYARDRRDMLGDGERAGAATAMGGAGASANAIGGGGKKKKKSFMLINDIEVEIEEDDDDDDDEEAEARPPQLESLEPALVLPPASLALPTPPASPPPNAKAKAKPMGKPSSSSSSPPSLSPLSTSPPSPIRRQPHSPRLAVRPLSPVSVRPMSPTTSTLSPTTATTTTAAARPVSPLTARPVSPLTPTSGRLSPVQARASSRLVRV